MERLWREERGMSPAWTLATAGETPAFHVAEMAARQENRPTGRLAPPICDRAEIMKRGRPQIRPNMSREEKAASCRRTPGLERMRKDWRAGLHALPGIINWLARTLAPPDSRTSSPRLLPERRLVRTEGECSRRDAASGARDGRAPQRILKNLLKAARCLDLPGGRFCKRRHQQRRA